LSWTRFPNKILDTSDQYLHRWYTDGEMNICYNAVDRHVEAGRGDETALLYDSAYTGVQEKTTYR
jgi:propionyl-CoA synthetase